MAHDHNHHHNIPHEGSLNKAFLWGIVLNIAFVAAELFAGWWSDSIALISDAGHNFSDVISLILAMMAFRLAFKAPNANYTYGYKKGTIVASFVNSVILVVAVVLIIIGSIDKIQNPEPVNGGLVAIVAGIGILINGFTTFILFRHKSHDLNVKGAFLHMLADTLVSVGVLVSGVVIKYTGWNLIDPIIGIAIAVIILYSTWGLFTQSLRLVLDGVPQGIDSEEVAFIISDVRGVEAVHHVHLWALSTTENALTAHIVIDNKVTDYYKIKEEIKKILGKKGITHVTLELESPQEKCCDTCCGT